MSRSIQPIKTTILGGLIFLVPIVIVLVILAKMYEIMAVLAAPFSAFIPIESVGGIATANIITILSIVVVCYTAGRIAMSGPGRKLYQSLDDKLVMLFPRYTFIKGMTESVGAEEAKRTLQTVLVKFDDQSQIGFEVERNDKGLVTVYLPGSPDPWSGTVAYVTEDRIEKLNASFNAVTGSLRKAGKGAGSLLG
jgi:uncharacterized membrane protein